MELRAVSSSQESWAETLDHENSGQRLQSSSVTTSDQSITTHHDDSPGVDLPDHGDGGEDADDGQ